MHCDVSSSRCFEICNDCMVSVIHRLWNINFMLGPHMEWLLTREVFETVQTQKYLFRSSQIGRLEACLRSLLTLFYTTCTGSSLEKELAQKALLRMVPLTYPAGAFPRNQSRTIQLDGMMSWCFLHVCARKRLHSYFYNIYFSCQEVKNDVQIQLVAGPDGGADAWLDCSPLHAR